MLPLKQLEMNSKKRHPEELHRRDVPAEGFRRIGSSHHKAAARRVVNGQAEEVFEPLNHVQGGPAPTLIHVSHSEVA
jgi:hypothetical protein